MIRYYNLFAALTIVLSLNEPTLSGWRIERKKVFDALAIAAIIAVVFFEGKFYEDALQNHIFIRAYFIVVRLYFRSNRARARHRAL